MVANINKNPFIDDIEQPLNFILEFPNLSFLQGIRSFLIDNYVGITNIDRETFSTLQTNIKESTLIFLPKPPYSFAKYEFSVSNDHNYESIIDISSIIPGVDNALFTYAIGSGGESLRTAIWDVTKKIFDTAEYVNEQTENGETKYFVDYQKLMSEPSESFGSQFSKSFVLSTTQVSDAILRLGSKVGTQIINTFKQISLAIGANDELIYNIGTKTYTTSNLSETITSGKYAKNFNSFISPKLWKGSRDSFPKIELNIVYICEKDTDQLVKLLNWLQQISMPLTLLAPIAPLKLSFYNINKGLINKTDKIQEVLPPVSTKEDKISSGILPLTYTQRNYGYFNLTNLTISSLGLGYANNPNSAFYMKSGIPLPIGIKIELTMESYDPFYYQLYTPDKMYGSEVKK